MSGIDPIAAIGAATPSSHEVIGEPTAAVSTSSFSDMLARGLAGVEQKVDAADELVRAFALDDSIPVHQVTIALEEARLSVELALQIRSRLVEGYREIMNMQL